MKLEAAQRASLDQCLPPRIRHVMSAFYSDVSFGTAQRRLLSDAERKEMAPSCSAASGVLLGTFFRSQSLLEDSLTPSDQNELVYNVLVLTIILEKRGHQA